MKSSDFVAVMMGCGFLVVSSHAFVVPASRVFAEKFHASRYEQDDWDDSYYEEDWDDNWEDPAMIPGSEYYSTEGKPVGMLFNADPRQKVDPGKSIHRTANSAPGLMFEADPWGLVKPARSPARLDTKQPKGIEIVGSAERPGDAIEFRRYPQKTIRDFIPGMKGDDKRRPESRERRQGSPQAQRRQGSPQAQQRQGVPQARQAPPQAQRRQGSTQPQGWRGSTPKQQRQGSTQPQGWQGSTQSQRRPPSSTQPRQASVGAPRFGQGQPPRPAMQPPRGVPYQPPRAGQSTRNQPGWNGMMPGKEKNPFSFDLPFGFNFDFNLMDMFNPSQKKPKNVGYDTRSRPAPVQNKVEEKKYQPGKSPPARKLAVVMREEAPLPQATKKKGMFQGFQSRSTPRQDQRAYVDSYADEWRDWKPEDAAYWKPEKSYQPTGAYQPPSSTYTGRREESYNEQSGEDPYGYKVGESKKPTSTFRRKLPKIYDVSNLQEYQAPPPPRYVSRPQTSVFDNPKSNSSWSQNRKLPSYYDVSELDEYTPPPQPKYESRSDSVVWQPTPRQQSRYEPPQARKKIPGNFFVEGFKKATTSSSTTDGSWSQEARRQYGRTLPDNYDISKLEEYRPPPQYEPERKRVVEWKPQTKKFGRIMPENYDVSNLEEYQPPPPDYDAYSRSDVVEYQPPPQQSRYGERRELEEYRAPPRPPKYSTDGLQEYVPPPPQYEYRTDLVEYVPQKRDRESPYF